MSSFSPESAEYATVPQQYQQLRTRVFAGFMAMTMSTIPGSGPAISAPACPIPSAASLEAVTSLMDNPPVPPELVDAEPAEKVQALAAEAARLNLHFASLDDETLWGLEGGVGAGPTDPNHRSFQDYYDAAESVLSQSGVQLHMGEVPQDEYSTKTPTAEELDTPQAKQSVMLLIDTFTKAQVELTRAMPIKDVYITAHVSRSDPAVITKGFAELNNGMIAIDVTAGGGSDYTTAPHEYAHHLNVFRCGSAAGALNDPGFVALNERASYAQSFPLPPDFLQRQPKSFEEIAPEYYGLNNSITQAESSGDGVTAEALTEQANDLLGPIEMQSVYSYSRPAEDEAELGKQILGPRTYGTMLDPRMPARRQKFLYLLAGLYERNSAAVTYYAYEYGLYRPPTNTTK